MYAALILESPEDRHPAMAVCSLPGLLARVNIVWDALVNSYHDGSLADWFRQIGRHDLAQAVEQVTSTPSVVSHPQRCHNLQNLLTTHLDFPSPQITLRSNRLDWGTLPRSPEPVLRSLVIYNSGRGCAYGKLVARRPELEVEGYEPFVLPPGEWLTRQIILHSQGLRPLGLHAAEGLSVRLRICRPEGDHYTSYHVACHARVATRPVSTSRSGILLTPINLPGNNGAGPKSRVSHDGQIASE